MGWVDVAAGRETVSWLDSQVTVLARKSGDNTKVRIAFGPQWMRGQGLELGARVRVKAGTQNDVGLLKIVPANSGAKVRQHTSASRRERGWGLVEFTVCGAHLKAREESVACKSVNTGDGFVLTLPKALRTLFERAVS